MSKENNIDISTSVLCETRKRQQYSEDLYAKVILKKKRKQKSKGFTSIAPFVHSPRKSNCPIHVETYFLQSSLYVQ